MSRTKSLTLVLLLLVLPGYSQEKESEPPPMIEGGSLFLEVTTQYLSFSHSDMDGTQVIGNADQVYYIPFVRDSLGFGIGFGRRFRSGLWSISYLVSGHDVVFQGRNGTAVSHLVQINSRTFLLKGPAAKVFLQFGLSFPWLTVDDNAADRDGNIVDATYLGVGANAGAGLLLPVSSRMFFSGSLIYRFLGYLYARGPAKGIDITDMFDGRNGPRHRSYLRSPAWVLELSLGYTL